MISTNECNGFLISGFPRNPKQASLFVRDIAPIDCMFYLEGQATDSSYSLDKSIGDSHSQEEGDKVQDEGDNLNETAKTTDSKVLVGKYDGLLERVIIFYHLCTKTYIVDGICFQV